MFHPARIHRPCGYGDKDHTLHAEMCGDVANAMEDGLASALRDRAEKGHASSGAMTGQAT